MQPTLQGLLQPIRAIGLTLCIALGPRLGQRRCSRPGPARVAPSGPRTDLGRPVCIPTHIVRRDHRLHGCRKPPFELAKTLLPSALAAAHMRAYKEPGRQLLPVVNAAGCRSPVIASSSTSQQLLSRQGSPIRQAAAAALAAADNGGIGSTSAPRPLLPLVVLAVLCIGTAALAATLLPAHLHPGAAVGLSSSVVDASLLAWGACRMIDHHAPRR